MEATGEDRCEAGLPERGGDEREFWWVVGNEAVFRGPNSSTICFPDYVGG